MVEIGSWSIKLEGFWLVFQFWFLLFWASVFTMGIAVSLLMGIFADKKYAIFNSRTGDFYQNSKGLISYFSHNVAITTCVKGSVNGQLLLAPVRSKDVQRILNELFEGRKEKNDE